MEGSIGKGVENASNIFPFPDGTKLELLLQISAEFLGRNTAGLSPVKLLQQIHEAAVIHAKQDENTLKGAGTAELLKVLFYMQAPLDPHFLPKTDQDATFKHLNTIASNYQQEMVRVGGKSVPKLTLHFPPKPGQFRKGAEFYTNGEILTHYTEAYLPAKSLVPLYITAPEFSVTEMMNALSLRYGKDSALAVKNGDKAAFAEALSRFYLFSLGVVHPFPDGNGIAHRIFLIHEMRKKADLDLNIPMNPNGNPLGDWEKIPAEFSWYAASDSPFKPAQKHELTARLAEFGLGKNGVVAAYQRHAGYISNTIQSKSLPPRLQNSIKSMGNLILSHSR